MTNSKARPVVTATVGYMCLALSIWMYSMPNAAWFSKLYGHGIAMLYPLGIVLGVMGILSFIQGRTLDSIIFFGGTGLLWSMQLYFISATTADALDPRSYSGWYYFIWAVFFCYVWIGSFKSGLVRILFLLGLWLTLLAIAIGHWGNLHSIMLVGGYLGLITAILAAITSAEEVISFGMKGEDRDAATV
jgi:succinate-acetate transporter protein